MELVSLAKEMLQDVAEHAASYRLGQSTLRQLDRALWTVEKCARWAVPPPLDQDERPQPELVRPLPWVFFLALLVALRVTRESISLLNLVLGKPPLRSADVVTYIQGKRRYLRTLKYQGGRALRARAGALGAAAGAPRRPWLSSLSALLERAACFRTRYGNNNTRLSSNEEVLVVKRSKRGGHEAAPTSTPNETTMERLIEKILVDLDAESDDDSSYTLTNVTSIRSDQSGYNTESDHDTAIQLNTSTPNKEQPVETTSKTNNGSVPTLDLNLGNATDINTNTLSERLENISPTLESEDATRNDDVSKNHCEGNGNLKGQQQKIANGRAITGPPSSQSESNGEEANLS